MRPRRIERLERFLLKLIQKPGEDQGHPWSIRFLLFNLKVLSLLYRSVVQLRLIFFNRGIMRRYPLGVQVISVGNVTVGGTGKTPVVEIFSRELQKAGRKVAILSRGYRKKEDPFWERVFSRVLLREANKPPRVVSDGKNLLLDSEMSGDEPYMLAGNLRDVSVVVDKDRVKGGRYAINRLGCDTLILDDGFQYQRLKHSIEVVLVDSTNPFGNGNCLPRGILREPAKNIKRADFIFITKSDGSGHHDLRKQILALNPAVEFIECCHQSRHLRHVFSKGQEPLDILKGMRVVALSGIAAPTGFERSLVKLGAQLVERVRFADHHRFTQQEIIDVINRAAELKAEAIVTTEKDAVRMARLDRCDVPIYYLRVDIEILDGAQDFWQCIERICFKGLERRKCRVRKREWME